jgi:hypothetical protein
VSVVRVGATKQYSDNWDNIFGGRSSTTKRSVPKAARKSSKKSAKAAKKSTVRKRGGRTNRK